MGTVSGHVLLWALGPRQRLLELPCDSDLLRKAAITRVVWSADGSTFGEQVGAESPSARCFNVSAFAMTRGEPEVSQAALTRVVWSAGSNTFGEGFHSRQ